MNARITGAPSVLGQESTSPTEYAATAAQTTAENPWPLRLLSAKMKEYIDRMSSVWIEGQIVELNHRGKASYLTLRDTDVEMSLPVQIWKNVLDQAEAPLSAGSRVVVNVKADFWTKAGRLSMRANSIRAVGLGELLARLEHLRRQLGQEGLFDPQLKKKLPFLPGRIGLITGRDSDAEKDVVRNAQRRWPAVKFEIINTLVQGPDAVPQVIRALETLDAHHAVDVIIIARGGGSLEDLLPFSNESLVRAVGRATTPIVSAIGHEADRPILDDIADLRASTPTDAAKRVVPDVAEEQRGIEQARGALDRAINNLLARETQRLVEIRSRPVLANPETMVSGRRQELSALLGRAWQSANNRTMAAEREVAHLLAQVRALSPQKTLARGYSVVQLPDGLVVRDARELSAGSALRIRLAHGSADATTTLTYPEEKP